MSRRKRPATKDEILDAVRAAVKAADGGRIRLRAFLGATGIKTRDIHTHFPTWNALLRAAGFHFDQYNQRIDDHALLTDWATVARKLQRLPSAGEYRRHGAYSISAITRRFRGWNPIHEAFRSFAVAQPQWNDILALLPSPSVAIAKRDESRHSPVLGTTPDRRTKIPRSSHDPTAKSPSSLHPSAFILHSFPSRPARTPLPNGRPLCGSPLEFDAMRNAPINEMGVIFLFALLATPLGFRIESLQSAFPDCEAKRLLWSGTWQTVRIEFEFESRNFRDHGHDPAGCDIIVCWEHNWEDSPKRLEVIALSDEINALGGRSQAKPPGNIIGQTARKPWK